MFGGPPHGWDLGVVRGLFTSFSRLKTYILDRKTNIYEVLLGEDLDHRRVKNDVVVDVVDHIDAVFCS